MSTDQKLSLYLHMSQLRERWGCSHMFVERRIKTDPTFPKAYKFAAGPSAWRYWRLDEIEAWERTRIVMAA